MSEEEVILQGIMKENQAACRVRSDSLRFLIHDYLLFCECLVVVMLSLARHVWDDKQKPG